MKVFLLTSNLSAVGGIQQHSRDLVDVLRNSPNKFLVVEAGEGFLKKIWFVLSVFWHGLRIRPDIIISCHINYSFVAFLLSKIIGASLVIFAHGVEVWSKQGKTKELALSKAKRIIAVSEYTKRRILENTKNVLDNIVVMGNTVHGDIFFPTNKPESIVDKYKLGGKKVILTVGRLVMSEGKKGHDLIINALPDVAREIPNVVYMIVGDGNDRSRIEKLANDLDVLSRVIMVGRVESKDLPKYYNACDIFVMPSTQEGFGYAFIEALACGKPVIAGNRDGSVDAVLGGDIGILVDPLNQSEITEAIIKGLKGIIPEKFKNPKLLHDTIIEIYGFEKFSKNFLNILYELSR